MGRANRRFLESHEDTSAPQEQGIQKKQPRAIRCLPRPGHVNITRGMNSMKTKQQNK